ncbi:MAG: AAA family ATPase [Candidatus Symbiobacter sp.]|nr:AAA family ATPase [Candidatus Symbiobacter sp.]
MLLEKIYIANLLSFDSKGIDLELRPLNVFVGANGMGKSNLVEVFNILRNLPNYRQLSEILSKKTIDEWNHKSNDKLSESESTIQALISPLNDLKEALHYRVDFRIKQQSFDISFEVLENAENLIEGSGEYDSHYAKLPGVFYLYNKLSGVITKTNRSFESTKSPNYYSVFSQVKEKSRHFEITWLGESLSKIYIYRNWNFGSENKLRKEINSNQFGDFVNEDYENLPNILNLMTSEDYDLKQKFLGKLQDIFPNIQDFGVQIIAGSLKMYVTENGKKFNTNTLSDGTLRYLFLLTILLHPDPPPLICLEEPELGLHPDMLPGIAALLKDAATRTQLIVTTHSDIILDALSDTPESVVVCEKDENGTKMTRLNAEKLKDQLAEYGLGQMWRNGEFGGNRW